jgi:transcriptional/translational regulatory protein YebC/TACO1
MLKELEKEINNFISTEIEWIPLNDVSISKEKNEVLINFFETLEDDDDVQNIFSNAKFIK